MLKKEKKNQLTLRTTERRVPYLSPSPTYNPPTIVVCHLSYQQTLNKSLSHRAHTSNVSLSTSAMSVIYPRQFVRSKYFKALIVASARQIKPLPLDETHILYPYSKTNTIHFVDHKNYRASVYPLRSTGQDYQKTQQSTGLINSTSERSPFMVLCTT